jgi:hypothetical protein
MIYNYTIRNFDEDNPQGGQVEQWHEIIGATYRVAIKDEDVCGLLSNLFNKCIGSMFLIIIIVIMFHLMLC